MQASGGLDVRTRFHPGGPRPMPADDATPLEPRPSAPSLPLANGSATAIYDVHDRRVTGFFNHMYKKYDRGSVTVDLCQKASIGVAGANAPGALEYLNGTGILKETRTQGPLQVEQFYFMPMERNAERLMVMLTRVTNKGDKATDAAVVADLDFNVGQGGQPDPLDTGDDVDHKWHGNQNEVIVKEPASGTLFEYSPDQPHMMAYRSAGSGQLSVRGDRILQEGATTIGDGLRAVLEGTPEKLEPGQSRWEAVVVAHEEVGDRSTTERRDLVREALGTRIEGYLSGRSPEQLLVAEQGFWEGYHAVEPRLEHLSADRKAVYRQSTAFLKMGQVQEAEHPESSGQILASLKDKWARSWVRDASYAIVGLVRSGHMQEAGEALQFMLGGRRDGENDYRTLINQDLPEERKLDDYLVSVCRYFGNGQEESDYNDHGPNVEYDNFGLFLWAFSEYSEKLPPAERQEFLGQHLDKVRDLVAEPLVRLQGENGLIAADSSIWEHHWTHPLEYDGRRHYAYTSITACQGLESFANVLQSEGRPQDARRLHQAAAAIKDGLKHLKNADGSLASSLEDLQHDPSTAYDASVLEAVNWGLLEGDDGPSREDTVEAIFDRLRSRTPGSPGLMRNDDGNSYDSQEWLLMDLRGVEALRQVGQSDQAEELMNWVTGWARQNYDGIGELLDEEGNFEGPFPMAGFGPGAYILAANGPGELAAA